MLRTISMAVALVFVFAASVSAATVRVTVDNTPIRVSASATAAVVVTVRAGTTLDLLDLHAQWFRVRDPRTKVEGWIQVSAAELVPGSVGEQPRGQSSKASPSTPGAIRRPAVSRWAHRGYLSMNGLYQGGASESQQDSSWIEWAEVARVTVTYPARNGPAFSVSGGYRVWRDLVVGGGVSVASRSTEAAVSGTVPNRLYLNQPIPVSGTLNAKRTETAVHVQATWVAPLAPTLVLMVSGGPSFFSVRETTVTGIEYSTAYPYDTVSVYGASGSAVTRSGVGFNVGADLTYMLTRSVGVGGLVRFARASLTYAASGSTTQSVPFNAGGFQAGGGLRVFFGGPKPAKPTRPAAPAPPRR